MKKKIRLYFIALIALALYLIAGNEKLMLIYMTGWNNDKRPELLKNDKYLYGDLYGVSFLSEYRSALRPQGRYSSSSPKNDVKSEGDIWIIGDSFLAEKFRNQNSSSLYNSKVKSFYWIELFDNKPRLITFDSSNKRILLIEMSERFVRERFTSDRFVKKINSCYTKNENCLGNSDKSIDNQFRIVPKTMEQNLETILFGYKILEGIKGAKADFAFSLFNRTAPNVFVSTSQNRLFLSSTIDSLQIASSFKFISDTEIGTIIHNMNLVDSYYKNMGFDEVVYCLIPNAASVCPPPGYKYNLLIPRIQQSTDLHVDYVDVYGLMSSSPEPCSLFWKSDTHWNVEGYSIWENRFNEYLKSLYQPK